MIGLTELKEMLEEGLEILQMFEGDEDLKILKKNLKNKKEEAIMLLQKLDDSKYKLMLLYLDLKNQEIDPKLEDKFRQTLSMTIQQIDYVQKKISVFIDEMDNKNDVDEYEELNDEIEKYILEKTTEQEEENRESMKSAQILKDLLRDNTFIMTEPIKKIIIKNQKELKQIIKESKKTLNDAIKDFLEIKNQGYDERGIQIIRRFTHSFITNKRKHIKDMEEIYDMVQLEIV